MNFEGYSLSVLVWNEKLNRLLVVLISYYLNFMTCDIIWSNLYLSTSYGCEWWLWYGVFLLL